jgi:hypothetical protein
MNVTSTTQPQVHDYKQIIQFENEDLEIKGYGLKEGAPLDSDTLSHQ